MDKNKAILVEKNGKQLKYKLNDRSNSSAEKEFAAALDDSDDTIPVLTGLHKSKKAGSKMRKNKYQYFKPIIFAIGSAIIVGSILGFVMLRLFVDVEADMVGQTLNNNPSTAVTENKETTTTSSINLEPLQAHILQVGLFSEKVNAEEWASIYNAKGLPTMTWERDNQFFLIAGAANTKEDAKFLADELKLDNSVDIFVKEWTTINGEIELTEEEENWMELFRSLWQDTLNNLNEQNTFPTEKWTNLLEQKPDESTKLTPLLSSISESGGDGDHLQLLEWMYFYEQLLE
ncbi:hypothetical protein ACFOUV_02255 [Oceanobacillus longus]|uniref:SPOR domain-containing protein n=1 Tax=Oceanobacillus longus TaxID=930120 RepID=A0ABV8GRZ8_9BACI